MNSPSDLFSFRIELSMACPRCDHAVPVDGPVSRAHCMYCQNDLVIERDYWITHIGEACSDMQNTPLGQGSGSMFLGTNTGNLTLGRLNPYCDNCKTDFSDPWGLSPGTVYECAECGSRWPVSSPPEWISLALPRVKLLINALLEKDNCSEFGHSGASLISLSCPSCSGDLSVDGSSRLVRCRYCDTQIYLPDDIWARLHGTKRKRRWFVVCEERNPE